jgi:AcrR family transcriptional regulator
VSSVAASASAAAQPHDTRARILDAALELFSEHGFDGTTLQQIADRLGFTKAALYYHFRSKDDLLRALIAPAVTGLDELLGAYEHEPDTPGRRRRFVTDYVDLLLEQRKLISYMASDIAIVAHPMIASGARERQARIKTLLAAKELEFSQEVRVAVAFKAMAGVVAQYPDADVADLRSALIDLATDLLRPGRRHPRQ